MKKENGRIDDKNDNSNSKQQGMRCPTVSKTAELGASPLTGNLFSRH
jgi:hypothetical protein